MEKEVIIKQSQQKQFSLILLGIIMVFLSAFVFGTNDSYLFGLNFIPKIIGGIGIIFFGACLIFIIKGFISPQNILVIDQKGITDKSSAISIGFISWGDIESCYITTVFNQKFISIDVKNLEEKIKELPFYKRVMINLNRKMGYSPVSITLNSTKYKPEEVLEIIHNYSHEN